MRSGAVLKIGPGHGSTLPYVGGAIKDGSVRSITFLFSRTYLKVTPARI